MIAVKLSLNEKMILNSQSHLPRSEGPGLGVNFLGSRRCHDTIIASTPSDQSTPQAHLTDLWFCVLPCPGWPLISTPDNPFFFCQDGSDSPDCRALPHLFSFQGVLFAEKQHQRNSRLIERRPNTLDFILRSYSPQYSISAHIASRARYHAAM